MQNSDQNRIVQKKVCPTLIGNHFGIFLVFQDFDKIFELEFLLINASDGPRQASWKPYSLGIQK